MRHFPTSGGNTISHTYRKEIQDFFACGSCWILISMSAVMFLGVKGLRVRDHRETRNTLSFPWIFKTSSWWVCLCSDQSASCSVWSQAWEYSQSRETLTKMSFSCTRCRLYFCTLFQNTRVQYRVGAELLTLANKNAERRVKCEFQTNTKYFLV